MLVPWQHLSMAISKVLEDSCILIFDSNQFRLTSMIQCRTKIELWLFKRLRFWRGFILSTWGWHGPTGLTRLTMLFVQVKKDMNHLSGQLNIGSDQNQKKWEKPVVADWNCKHSRHKTDIFNFNSFFGYISTEVEASQCCWWPRIWMLQISRCFIKPFNFGSFYMEVSGNFRGFSSLVTYHSIILLFIHVLFHDNIVFCIYTWFTYYVICSSISHAIHSHI